MDEQEEVVQRPKITIDEEAIWATRIEDNQIRVYINKLETLTFTFDAACALYLSLRSVLEPAKPPIFERLRGLFK
jgi:hypothetical protein